MRRGKVRSLENANENEYLLTKEKQATFVCFLFFTTKIIKIGFGRYLSSP